MKIGSMMMAIVAVAVICRAGERPRLRGREAPRATDLLRAERMAEQAQKRLKMPSRHGGGWEHGGSGWDAPPGPSTDEGSERVIINVRPPKRRPRPGP